MRTNGKYIILNSFQIPTEEYEFVMAKHTEFKSYVTWQYSKRNDSYFWGHYFSDYGSAFIDYCNRINEEVKWLHDNNLLKL